MKSRNIVIALLIVILIIISNVDRRFQINKEFQSMLTRTIDASVNSKLYGPGLERLLNLYQNESYNEPQLSIVGDYKKETIISITVMKYDNTGEAYGNVTSSDSTYFRCVFYSIPILNIDFLRRVIPED